MKNSNVIASVSLFSKKVWHVFRDSGVQVEVTVSDTEIVTASEILTQEEIAYILNKLNPKKSKK